MCNKNEIKKEWNIKLNCFFYNQQEKQTIIIKNIIFIQSVYNTPCINIETYNGNIFYQSEEGLLDFEEWLEDVTEVRHTNSLCFNDAQTIDKKPIIKKIKDNINKLRAINNMHKDIDLYYPLYKKIKNREKNIKQYLNNHKNDCYYPENKRWLENALIANENDFQYIRFNNMLEYYDDEGILDSIEIYDDDNFGVYYDDVYLKTIQRKIPVQVLADILGVIPETIYRSFAKRYEEL